MIFNLGFHNYFFRSTENDDRAILCCSGWFITEARFLLTMSATTIIHGLLNVLLHPVCLIFAGHIGVDELDGVALSLTFLLLFGQFYVGGLVVACDTLFSQAYGSSNPKEVGVYVQKGLVMSYLYLYFQLGFSTSMQKLF